MKCLEILALATSVSEGKNGDYSSHRLSKQHNKAVFVSTM